MSVLPHPLALPTRLRFSTELDSPHVVPISAAYVISTLQHFAKFMSELPDRAKKLNNSTKGGIVQVHQWPLPQA
jgi:hypothetical protein